MGAKPIKTLEFALSNGPVSLFPSFYFLKAFLMADILNDKKSMQNINSPANMNSTNGDRNAPITADHRDINGAA